MKVRIRGNSIRIRLSKSEVELFDSKGLVEERTDFGSNTLVYSVISTGGENMSATFKNDSIKLYVPGHLLKQWATTSEISLAYDQPVSNDKFLNLLLEKDFKCIDAVITEEQSDYFENPAKSC